MLSEIPQSNANPPEGLLTDAERRAVAEHEATIQDKDFIHRWEAYGRSRTDAPAVFHQQAALGLVAAAIDRNRWLDLQHKRVYPAVYGLSLAESGQRKSTPQTYAVQAAAVALEGRLLANDYSPEALITDLAERQPSRGLVFIDEAGRLLGTMRKDRYGEGLKDLLSHLWDAPDRYARRLQKGPFTLESVYLNIQMATTRGRFVEQVTIADVQSGFLPRFLPVIASEPVSRRPLRVRADETDGTADGLAQDLRAMGERLRAAPGAIAISPEGLACLDRAEAALEAWAERAYHADLIRPWARRLAEYGLRLAVIYAVSEGQERVERPQALRAIAVIDRAKEDVGMLVEDLTISREAREREKLYRFIRANPGISGRDLYRRTNRKAQEVRADVDEMARQGRVRVQEGSKESYQCWALDPSVCHVSVASVENCQQGARETITNTTDSVTDDSSPTRVAA